ncbi:xylose isomerase-like protein [Lepidopterella palustris CBS 459.81]|uniref:Xylose isomerase-like protein n=1 Tax=Lepidopterella palustris CBS 459.81 TaxID=1314670 RepID=A0A8E2DW54_9PEZI|nr:xylose isomerase-like protein [Lepidopterella palustris CBS 459.81]
MPSKAGLPSCYASCSIGLNSNHNLCNKITAISNAGFNAIVLWMSDLLSFASERLGKELNPKDYDDLCAVGEDVKKLCQKQKINILMLQLFANFEGWPKGSKERYDAFERVRGQIKIMESVGTHMLQVSVYKLSDLPTRKVSHRPLIRWPATFELCLDSFQPCGGEFGNPTTSSGTMATATLAAGVPPERIFILQISDVYRVDPPLENRLGENGLRSRGRWSHNFRPLPYDGGHLPVAEFTRAVLKTGFRGWISIEVFDRREAQKSNDIEMFGKKSYGEFGKVAAGSGSLMWG